MKLPNCDYMSAMHGLPEPQGPAATSDEVRMPLGRAGQLKALRRQFVECEQVLAAVWAGASESMVDENSDDGQRWTTVGQLRTVVYKIQRDILPLVERVPVWLHADPEYVECRRIAHSLRRSGEAALRDSTNYTVDLVNAQPLMAR